MISLGLIFNPKLVILDEVTTALDVITQGQLLDEIKRLVNEFKLTVMMITHDVGVVNEVCTKIAILYAGELLEYGDVKDIIFEPFNPYTQALVESHPDLNPEGSTLKGIPGILPDLINPPEGCIFYDRCKYRKDICKKEKPKLQDYKGRKVKCFRVGELHG
jgi:peptide/nickel transport system ATP-binding protein